MAIREKILKIMALALEINPPEIKGIGKKRTAVFVWWSPHCNSFEVSIYDDGWDADKGELYRIDICTSWDDSEEELDALIKRLEEIREEVAE